MIHENMHIATFSLSKKTIKYADDISPIYNTYSAALYEVYTRYETKGCWMEDIGYTIENAWLNRKAINPSHILLHSSTIK